MSWVTRRGTRMGQYAVLNSGSPPTDVRDGWQPGQRPEVPRLSFSDEYCYCAAEVGDGAVERLDVAIWVEMRKSTEPLVLDDRDAPPNRCSRRDLLGGTGLGKDLAGFQQCLQVRDHGRPALAHALQHRAASLKVVV
jgi:hypothetical protein